MRRFRLGAEVLRHVPLGQASFAGVETIASMVNAWLPPEDLAAFHALSTPREDGLRASRQGDALRAEARMEDAEAMIAGAALSPQGTLLAESMHDSARAYLLYRAGDYTAARAHLDAALASTNALHDEHGFPGAEARRLHLAHLVVRVETCRGADRGWIVETVCRLWDYVEGNAEAWPFAPCARPGAEISPRMAALSLNEIVTELALLVAAEPELEAGTLELLARGQRTRSRIVPYPFLYARAWHTMKSALHAGDPAKALHAAGRFLGVVDGPRPLLWYAAVRDAHHLCLTLPLPSARDAAATLATGAPPLATLPDSLRISLST